jgi:hypothetical protein
MSDIQITDWQQRGSVLAQAHRLQQFEIADWLVLGIEQYGATSAYDYAETVFPQYTRATFQVWVCVAKRFNSELRIESDWLTFAHYQVAQGAERDPWAQDPNSKLQVAQELVWLRKADEYHLTVSALRDTIARAYELRKEAFYNENPDARPKPVEPEPQPEPKKPEKDCYGGIIKEFQTPWLRKQTRWSLDELARARRVTTEQLLQRVIQDFLDAHSDEVGDAELAAKKRAAEHDAAVEAAEAVEKMKHEAARAEKAEREEREKTEIEAASVFGTASVEVLA